MLVIDAKWYHFMPAIATRMRNAGQAFTRASFFDGIMAMPDAEISLKAFKKARRAV